MRETVKEIMSDVVGASGVKRVAHNTVSYLRADGATVIRLHQTDVVVKLADGRVVLNSGGWQTHTTKDRLNAFSGAYQVYADRGQWYVTVAGGRAPVPFYDGMILPDAFANRAKADKEKADRDAMRARIKQFVDKLDKLAELPQPDSGDCWGCAMRAADGSRPMGGECVAGHVSEGYLHGSLILRAMEARNYGDLRYVWASATREWPHWRPQIKRDLRRFLQHELGSVKSAERVGF